MTPTAQLAPILTLAAVLTAAIPAIANPTLDLAPEASTPPTPDGARTTLGGYGELHVNHVRPGGDAEPSTTLDLHRLVLFVGHRFSDAIRFRLELEVEHAIAAQGQPGEVSVEQAFIDWELLGEALALRAGVVLVPMGIINQTHEPPTFHGVERPGVDKYIIPTTWREPGIGLVGQLGELVSYQVLLVGGLDASGLSLAQGVRGARTGAAEAPATGLALVAALALSPAPGLLLGVSAYHGAAGPEGPPVFDALGAPLSLAVRTTGLAAHVLYKAHGIEARGLLAAFFLGDTAALRRATDAEGQPAGVDAPARTVGGYVEVAYDLLSLGGGREDALLPFVRYESYDTASKIAGRPRTDTDEDRAVIDLVMGLTYRPIPPLAFKSGVILRSYGGSRARDTLVDLGLGYSF